METINSFLNFEILSLGNVTLTVGVFVSALVILVITVVVLWSIKKLLLRRKPEDSSDWGNRYALFQILRYVVWIIAILLIMDTFGLKLNVLLAGSAALLVGIGLGLQNTFNDFISGLILLFDRSIKVGDILEVDGDVVKIQKIGLRTCLAMNRDDIVAIIPNSMITTNKVINWSHQSKKTRFKITVGTAYGSDVEKVLKILKVSALEHPSITDKALINSRFIDFGNSSLDFELLFYSDNIFRIENVKSDIRKIINQRFIENGVTIPFPQMDLHVRSNEAGIRSGT